MKKIDERKNNGGRREGAGRKKSKNRVRMNLNIEKPLVTRLKEMSNMSDTVNDALRDYFNLSTDNYS